MLSLAEAEKSKPHTSSGYLAGCTQSLAQRSEGRPSYYYCSMHDGRNSRSFRSPTHQTKWQDYESAGWSKVGRKYAAPGKTFSHQLRSRLEESQAVRDIRTSIRPAAADNKTGETE